MRRGADSLSVLKSDARDGVEALIELLSAGRLMGVGAPDDATIRNGLRVVDGFDIAGLSADSHVLQSAHRAVAEQLHHLPEQRVRLDDGWNSESAAVAIATVIDHQRRAESDLHILRTLTEATSAAASGIDRLLRTFYLTLARLTAPTAAGVPPAELPRAVLTGRVPMGVAVEDISSRLALFTTSLETTTRGVAGILDLLNRSVDGIDDEAYPVDAESPRDPPVPPGGRPAGAVPGPPPAAPASAAHAWLAESTTTAPATSAPPTDDSATDGSSREIGAATASAVSGSAVSTPPPEPLEAARVHREPDDSVDIPFRLGGAEGHEPPGAPAAEGASGASAVTIDNGDAERASSEPVVSEPAASEPAASESDSPSTEAPVSDSVARDSGSTPAAPADRSSGDLALAGDQ